MKALVRSTRSWGFFRSGECDKLFLHNPREVMAKAGKKQPFDVQVFLSTVDS
jgi:hypothetical protein